MQDWKMTNEVARVEIDGPENDGRNKTDERWRTDIDGPEFAGLENEGQVYHGIGL